MRYIPLPYVLEHSFDSLNSAKFIFSSNLGRNDVAITGIKTDNEGIVWSDNLDKNGYVEIAKVKTLSYQTSLYNFEFSISLTTDKSGKGKIFVNPDQINPYYRRLAFISSESLLVADTCSLYTDSSSRGYVLFSFKEQDNYPYTNTKYILLKSIDVNGKSINNCVELTFQEYPFPNVNSISKLWFSLDWGIVKFVTKSNEVWSINNLP